MKQIESTQTLTQVETQEVVIRRTITLEVSSGNDTPEEPVQPIAESGKGWKVADDSIVRTGITLTLLFAVGGFVIFAGTHTLHFAKGMVV